MTGELRMKVWKALSEADRQALLKLRAERQQKTGERVELWALLEEIYAEKAERAA